MFNFNLNPLQSAHNKKENNKILISTSGLIIFISIIILSFVHADNIKLNKLQLEIRDLQNNNAKHLSAGQKLIPEFNNTELIQRLSDYTKWQIECLNSINKNQPSISFNHLYLNKMGINLKGSSLSLGALLSLLNQYAKDRYASDFQIIAFKNIKDSDLNFFELFNENHMSIEILS